MSKLSKEAISKKAQAFLKSSNKDSVLVAEDGALFLPENERYAASHARTLAKGEGYSGKIEEVKTGKTAKAEAKPEEAKTEEAPEAEKPKKATKKK